MEDRKHKAAEARRQALFCLASVEMAERHVREARKMVERQKHLIAEGKARGRDTREHESLLEIFQQSLAIFEADLEALRKEGTR